MKVLLFLSLALLSVQGSSSAPHRNRAPQTVEAEASISTQTVVTLLAGSITGLKFSNIYKFLGIPYAQPPTGVNRFASPIAYKPLPLTMCVPP